MPIGLNAYVELVALAALLLGGTLLAAGSVIVGVYLVTEVWLRAERLIGWIMNQIYKEPTC